MVFYLLDVLTMMSNFQKLLIAKFYLQISNYVFQPKQGQRKTARAAPRTLDENFCHRCTQIQTPKPNAINTNPQFFPIAKKIRR
jgi:hypothetical protein